MAVLFDCYYFILEDPCELINFSTWKQVKYALFYERVDKNCMHAIQQLDGSWKRNFARYFKGYLELDKKCKLS